MPTTGKPLVLAATTDVALAASLRAELEGMGCEVVVVGSVIDAIAELHGLEFDLAFVSQALPPRTGADFVRIAQHLSPDTEVVVVLDEGREDAPVEHVRLGAFDFLRRPPREGELDAVVDRALERRRARTSNAMYRASHAILGGAKPDDLPGVIVRLTAGVLEADGVAYFRMSGDRIELAESTGFHESPVEELAHLVEHLRMEGPAPILIPDDRASTILDGTRIRTAIAVPIVIGRHVTGVLAAQRTVDPRPYRRADTERMAVFAAQLRLALENARLIEKTVASERLAAVGELAAGVAHEIASPLTYVLGNAISASEEMQRPGFDAEELKAMIDDIKDGAERIRDIAKDLRTLSRGSSMTETFDLTETVRGALRIVGSTVRGALDVDLQLPPKLLVCGSPGRLSQVFINLIVNAAHAAKSTGRIVRLQLTCTRDDDQLVVVVRDDGPGIARKNLARIFDAFFTTKTAEAGTGLGLSICRSIVEAHGGTIQATSEIGRGTAFTIAMPAAQLALGSAA